MTRVLPTQMAIVVMPHLIPATTIPNGALERALTEPLADGRDEVIYLVCSHPRLLLADRQDDGSHPVLLADGRAGATIDWSGSSWWARVVLPPHATPSRIPWAVIDDALDFDERLPPIDVDVRADPDGDRAQNRQELLAWVYDRHLERDVPLRLARGQVDGGLIDLRLEYVGSSGADALRRPAGAHHKMPTILGRMLLYEPHRVVYLMACEIRVACFDEDDVGFVRALPIADAVAQHDVERRVLIAAAEDALFAACGAPYNKRNTARRRFPRSASGEALAALGVRRVALALHGLPDRVRLVAPDTTFAADAAAISFALRPS